MTDTPLAHEIEDVAKALFEHRFKETAGPWHEYKEHKTDIAEICRENARRDCSNQGSESRKDTLISFLRQLPS